MTCENNMKFKYQCPKINFYWNSKKKSIYPAIRIHTVSDELWITDTQTQCYEVREMKKIDSPLGESPEPVNMLLYMVKRTLQMWLRILRWGFLEYSGGPNKITEFLLGEEQRGGRVMAEAERDLNMQPCWLWRRKRGHKPRSVGSL